MSAGIDPVRLVRARWAVLAAAAPLLEAMGAPLPFRVTVQGTADLHGAGAASGNGVARYGGSSSAGATLAWFRTGRAVLSGGDESWAVSDGADADRRLDAGPAWADHVLLLDPRIRAGRYGFVSFYDDGWTDTRIPHGGTVFPPVFDTAATASALASRLTGTAAETAFHLVRMSEYEWLDRTSWRAAMGAAPTEKSDRSWQLLVAAGLTRWTGTGPCADAVPGLTETQARRAAVDYARGRTAIIPDDVRVESALRIPSGWTVRMIDYRDHATLRPTVVMVPDTGEPELL